ncbi:hypothetical protein HNR60_003291 [Rhodopseudomonas rhenobacensis]|uniref:Uncharacterized protein n=1 Tax=Rhodopseudomonas rhenobacensis TaxID=87461 RepID=A0A7W7Z5U3_9BRAD|nr:hypothetical protein [Rhodopseudomonas rhenobacensis]MBB5048524.1 hypothetical protein [Rhodopseudomonas rhenobacensis]
MLYRPSSFRKTAFALTAAAMVGLSFAPRTSAAQEITANTDCTQFTHDKIQKGENVGLGTKAMCLVQVNEMLGKQLGIKNAFVDVPLKKEGDMFPLVEALEQRNTLLREQLKGLGLKKQEQVLDRQIQGDASAGKCMDAVTQEINAAKAKGPLSPAMKEAFKARIAQCDRA